MLKAVVVHLKEIMAFCSATSSAAGQSESDAYAAHMRLCPKEPTLLYLVKDRRGRLHSLFFSVSLNLKRSLKPSSNLCTSLSASANFSSSLVLIA